MQTSRLTLISHPLCPYVQRAAIVLLEKGITFNRLNVDLSAKPAWFLEMSPTGKVPLLKISDRVGAQSVLFESMAICEYLEETQTGEPLYPQDPFVRAQHRAWIEFGSATLTDAWSYLNAQNVDVANEKGIALRHKLVRIEEALDIGHYFGGNQFSMVDAVFAPIFRYFEGLPSESNSLLFTDLAKVEGWRKSLMQRPSVIAAVQPDYAAIFQAHLKLHGSWLTR